MKRLDMSRRGFLKLAGAGLAGATLFGAADYVGGYALVGAKAQEAGKNMVAPTVPVTPSIETLFGEKQGNTRTYRLTASQFTQKIANFPIQEVQVWGYNGSTPGPTLIAYEGERVRIIVKNNLPDTPPPMVGPPKPVPTTVHFHGMHQPNEDDGVAGVSQPNPIQPGQSYTYEFTPGHTGTFAYHSHAQSAIQELRGLDGFFLILPKEEPMEDHVDKDFAMTLQQFAPPAEGELVTPFPPNTGDFPFSTINGKTGEAAGGALEIKEGDRVKIRLYNASNLSHSMHLHGHDFTLLSRNGHPVPKGARYEETTQNLAPGEFFEIGFTANNPGNWIFHCHVPHHTSNKMMDGYNGAPVGMTRIFHYAGYKPVPPEYFAYTGSNLPFTGGPE